jgi:hypothetical protein
MARKATTAPKFGEENGPGFGSLRTPMGELVATTLANWRDKLDEHHRTTPDDNLGWLRTVYVIPAAIGRAWRTLGSIDVVMQHNWDGRKRCRLRGVIGLDGQQWASTMGGEGAPADDVALTQLLTPEFVKASVAGGVYTYPERQDDKLVRTLGRNFFAVGPVYPKNGDDEWVLGYNVKCIPVDGLELGQWFKIQLPPAPQW